MPKLRPDEQENLQNNTLLKKIEIEKATLLNLFEQLQNFYAKQENIDAYEKSKEKEVS